jgi:hypothetical protein
VKIQTPSPAGSNLDNNAITPEEAIQNRMERNIMKTLIIVVVAFFLCTIWNQALYFLYNVNLVTKQFRNESVFYHFSQVMLFLNTCINPFIYFFQFEKFRKQLNDLFLCRK